MSRPIEKWELTCVRGMESGPIDADKKPAPITDVRVVRQEEVEANQRTRVKQLLPDAYTSMAAEYCKAVLANGPAPEPAMWECVAEKGVPVPSCPVELVVKGAVYVGGVLGEGLEPEDVGGEEGAEKERPTKYEVLYSSSAGKVDGSGSFFSLDQLRRPLHSTPRILRADLMKAKTPIGLDDRSTKDIVKIATGSVVVFLNTEQVAEFSCINAAAFRWGRVVVVDQHRRELLVVEFDDAAKDKRLVGIPSRLIVPWEEVIELGSSATSLQTTTSFKCIMGLAELRTKPSLARRPSVPGAGFSTPLVSRLFLEKAVGELLADYGGTIPPNLFHLRQGNGHKYKDRRKIANTDNHTPQPSEKSRKCWYCFRSVAKQCFACPSRPQLCTHCGKLWHHAELVKAAAADPKVPMPRPLRREELLPTQLAKMKFHEKWMGLKKTGLSSTAAYDRLKEEEKREKAAEEDAASDSPADPIGDAESLGDFGPAH